MLKTFWGCILIITIVLSKGVTPVVHAQGTEEEVTFEIKAFMVEGNTLFEDEKIETVLKPFTGLHKTATDVEKARDSLEKFHHEAGYPTVLVNIPEQTVEDGMVRLEVIESTIRRVRITGNRYFTMKKIMRDLPSFRPGETLYLPKVQEELNRINRNPDFKVAPILMPGKELGTIDVQFDVKDRLPLHGSFELNNRSSPDTTDLRLNGVLRFDNLWQREHSISFQYQTSPEDTDEVKIIIGSYVFPTPWNPDHLLAVYGLWSDSQIAFGEGFQVVGKGNIYGARYMIPLPSYKDYTHNITLGIDYKDFDDSLGFATEDQEADETPPVTYVPLSFVYSSSVGDKSGITTFSAGASMAFRGAVTDQREFEDNREEAKGNYLCITAGIERMQKLFAGTSLFMKLDGQFANQPLISNEQYVAGGVESVRGHKEAEALGDNAVHCTVEYSGPDLADLIGLPDGIDITPFLFYDAAALKIKDPLADEDQSQTLQGAGAGVRGFLSRYLEYEFDWAIALSDIDEIDHTESGEERIYFKIKYQF